ncbi:M28 family metallopeptidase [Algoriphagus sp.]|uniref:M28 family metallopeptidase n=1 Tax=Algoriphagus sp. TaxID=1872435 RepID=UPI0025DE0A9B|nr:M28 family metallopeptidase [Algoriphagus sp.]
MLRIFIVAAACMLSLTSVAQNSIIGFKAANIESQNKLEDAFDAQLSSKNLDEWMQLLSDRPHYVGTEYGRQNAEWMIEQFTSWGFDAKIETYHVLFPYPKIRLLELTKPTSYKAKLSAIPIAEDKYTQQKDELLPSYNAFSKDGDVEAELVFVNYGIPADYEELEKLGIDVKGKIVIAKYAGSWRGIKPKLAAEKGAIGCIIYSDPEDDGYYRGDTYPEGAFKNETGVQRGSVMDMPLYPGDVLTPGYAATKDAKRLDRKDAPTITKIPVLPISYQDALPLLKALGGPVVPDSWKGALPITYHVGPGPAMVHLKLEFDWELKPIYNVIAKMKGDVFPDQWVMRGNHHDAWVHGANDPISGLVALLEEARAIGELVKAGYKPKRTLVYCAWDAEEPGLIGSTEWVEDHKDELQKKVVAYVNSDSNGRGFLFAGGSHTLQAMFSEIADDVVDPQTGVSVKKRRSAFDLLNGGDGNFRLGALGSGSDYSPFIQHAGIASLNLGYFAENAGGEYHTIYDTYTHYKQFKDPDFEYGIALAKTAGRIVLRLANSDVLPFEFQQWNQTVSGYMSELIKLTDGMRAAVEKHNTLVEKNVFELATDPKKNLAKPGKKELIPYLDFTSLQNEMVALNKVITDFSAKDFSNLDQAKSNKLNEKLLITEQALINEAGLPRRPWYKHQLYAPGFYTGYGVKTLPGVREAIEQENWEEAADQIKILTNTLRGFKNHIEEMLSIVE